jgi:rhodanese-related sulfurtransferase
MMDNITPILAILVVGFLFYPRLMIILDKNIKNVTGPEAVELVQSNKNMVILDVRTREEFNSGHIKGAKNIPVSELLEKAGELEQYRGKPLLVHCASGHRSAKAVRILSKKQFGPIYHMNRGISSWTGGLAG